MVIILIAAVIILYFIISNFGSSTADSQPMDAATRSAGATEETAKPLGEILPLICPYERLDEDIKWNLEQNPDAKFVYNFRTINLPPITYQTIISTSSSDEGDYFCDYTMISHIGHRFMIFYNIYEFMDVEIFLRQIRVKKDGVYQYIQSPEVKAKFPTFCKLYNNAHRVDKELLYDLPFLTTLDAERKILLLAVWVNESSLDKMGDLDKYHIALWKVLGQLLEELRKGGILDQTKENLVKNFFRIGRILTRLS